MNELQNPENMQSTLSEQQITMNISDVEEDTSFTFDGYQVVRGEFFSHIYEPSFTFSNYKCYVNATCVKKLPAFEYVQILVNPEDKKLAVRPCKEEEKDSFRWCSNTTKRTPKQITCRIFYSKVISLMNWSPNFRYKLLGKLIRSGNELLFVFDLTSPEIFTRNIKDGEKEQISTTPSFPEDWKNQFGLPVEEHRKNVQVNIFNGYAVFGMEKDPKKKVQETPSVPQAPEKGDTYEQQQLTLRSIETNPTY